MTPEQVRHARDLLTHPGNSVSSISRLLGVSRPTMTNMCPGSPPQTGSSWPSPPTACGCRADGSRAGSLSRRSSTAVKGLYQPGRSK
jgi:hypothetical protein